MIRNEEFIYKPCGDCQYVKKNCPCPHRGYCLCDDNDGFCIHSDYLKKRGGDETEQGPPVHVLCAVRDIMKELIEKLERDSKNE